MELVSTPVLWQKSEAVDTKTKLRPPKPFEAGTMSQHMMLKASKKLWSAQALRHYGCRQIGHFRNSLLKKGKHMPARYWNCCEQLCELVNGRAFI